ncbi:MAG TPA: nucleotide exchange factor GrpE [Haliangiales bacterium]|nr:nucleotide exchange factor GrpE [Haliangiales bacterium]
MTDENETPEVPVEVEVALSEPVAADDREKLAALEKEKQDLYDRLLRTAADFDNYKKRVRREMEEARLKAKEEVLREILPGLDNLERAIAAAAGVEGAAGVVEGVKLVLRQFHSALERFDVRSFSTVGEAFDPARHEAIAQVETDEHPPGSVASEMQRGYTIGPRLLRAALVAVAKAPPGPEPPEPSEPPPSSSNPGPEGEPPADAETKPEGSAA